MQQFSIENFLNELQVTLSSMPISEDVNSSLSTMLISFENVLNKHAPSNFQNDRNLLKVSHGLQKTASIN